MSALTHVVFAAFTGTSGASGSAATTLGAGVATGSAKKFAAMRSSFEWVTPASGSLLLGYGTYQTLVGLFGAV